MRAAAGPTAFKCALGVWFALSVVAQDPLRKIDKMRRIDPYTLFLPDWRFFAPNPGVDDYHLLYRDCERSDGSGEVTAWREVTYVTERSLRHFLWHPKRRIEKTIFDASSEIIQLCYSTGDSSRARMTIPYITLLNYVRLHGRHDDAHPYTQFLLATSDGYNDSEEPMLLFQSDPHPRDVPGQDRRTDVD